MWMTFGIFFNWAQGFTFRNRCTIDMVALKPFSTIGGDNGVINAKCLMSC